VSRQPAANPIALARGIGHRTFILPEQLPSLSCLLIGLPYDNRQSTQEHPSDLYRTDFIGVAVGLPNLADALAFQDHDVTPQLLKPLCQLKGVPACLNNNSVMRSHPFCSPLLYALNTNRMIYPLHFGCASVGTI